MYKMLLAVSIIGFCAAQAQFAGFPTIVEYVNNIGLGNYNFRYKISDGTLREETGELVDEGTPEENYIVKGKSEWQSPDGAMYETVYVADRYGYYPVFRRVDVGAPRPVPIPQVPQTVRPTYSTTTTTTTTSKPTDIPDFDVRSDFSGAPPEAPTGSLPPGRKRIGSGTVAALLG